MTANYVEVTGQCLTTQGAPDFQYPCGGSSLAGQAQMILLYGVLCFPADYAFPPARTLGHIMQINPWIAATTGLAAVVLVGGGVLLGAHLNSTPPGRPVAAVSHAPLPSSHRSVTPRASARPAATHSSHPAPAAATPAGWQPIQLNWHGGDGGPGQLSIMPSTIQIGSHNEAMDLTWPAWPSCSPLPGALNCTGYTTTGTGTISADNCVPNCAEGTSQLEPVTITLSNPTGAVMDNPVIWGSLTETNDGQTQTFSAIPGQ
jgi:hypothetical protein